MEGSKHDNNPESFQKEIHAVSEAEKTAEQLLVKAQHKSQELILEANSRAVSISTASSKDSVVQKDKIIHESRKETDKKVQKILSHAQAHATEISKMRLSLQKASKLAEDLL